MSGRFPSRTAVVWLVALCGLAWILSAEQHHPPVTFATMVDRGQRLGALSRALGLEDATPLNVE